MAQIIINLVTFDIDILMISETKVDGSFASSQFVIDGFSMPCARGGVTLVYFRTNITAKLLKLENLPSDIEAIFIEMNIKSRK